MNENALPRPVLLHGWSAGPAPKGFGWIKGTYLGCTSIPGPVGGCAGGNRSMCLTSMFLCPLPASHSLSKSMENISSGKDFFLKCWKRSDLNIEMSLS